MALSNIGALWLQEKNGRKYMSGTIETDKLDQIPQDGKIQVAIFRNDNKEGNQPDYRIVQIVRE